jgi:hypothetical protein
MADERAHLAQADGYIARANDRSATATYRAPSCQRARCEGVLLVATAARTAIYDLGAATRLLRYGGPGLGTTRGWVMA